MATWYSNELANFYSNPVVKASAMNGVGAPLRRYTASVTLNSQASGDTIVIGQIPTGADFAFGVITSGVSLGTSTIAIGTSASAGLYRAAATFTATDTPTMFGTAAQVKTAPLTAEQQVIITVSTAALPASGTLVVDLYFNAP